MTLIALMIYQSYLIEAELQHITNNFTSLKQFTGIFEQVLQIQRTMKQFNKFINQFIMMSITFNSISTIAYVNVLYFETQRKLGFLVASIAECLSIMLIICYYSNKANHNYSKLLDKFVDLELVNTRTVQKVTIDFSIVNRLYSIRDDMCFTAFNLYKINIKTFLSVMSLVITFSVILMQTNGQVYNFAGPLLPRLTRTKVSDP